jgi:LPLT family lysophospholipid transporter-like MFS transporter
VLKWADRPSACLLDKATDAAGRGGARHRHRRGHRGPHVSLRKSVRVMPLGIAMGVVVMGMIFVTDLPAGAGA